MAKGIKTGGRKAGTPNRVTRTVREALEAAFRTIQKDPKVKLTVWAKANPTEFYKLAARLIPHDVKVSGKLTLEQLVEASRKADDPGG